MSAIIYLLTNTINGKQYVGQTRRGLDARWQEHCRYAHKGAPQHLYNAIRKYGSDSFTQEILEDLGEATNEYINEREMYWVNEKMSCIQGYNMTEGGGGTSGWIRTKEWREKVSAAKAGKNHHMYGKKHTEETKAKISAGITGDKNPNYGKPMSMEQRRKLSHDRTGEKSVWYGRKHTEETKAKIRESQKGRPKTEAHKAKLSDARKLYNRLKCIIAPEAKINTITV